MVGKNQENIGSDLILEYLFCQKLLYWYYSVRPLIVMQEESASSFLKLRESNGTILPHNVPYSTSDLVEQIPCE
jgi:hypothetical protein